jgi:S1-C subfamily serine protease
MTATASNTKRQSQTFANVERAVVQLSKTNGRGVLVPGGFILTAAHCIAWDGTGGMALGNDYFQHAKAADGRKLLLDVLAVEPVADIALLGSPDNQRLWKQAEAYEQFVADTRPVRLFRGEWKPLEKSRVFVFHKDRRWGIATAATYTPDSRVVILDPDRPIRGGASGGPVISRSGELVTVVSQSGESGGDEGAGPMILHTLPVWAAEMLAAADLEVRNRRRSK